jgi:hypothetical protein
MWKHCFLLLIGIGNWQLSYCQVSFNEESVQSGILHSYVHLFQIGGGVAIFDFDNDGWEDIYFTGGEQSDKLYQNLGTGQFQDITIASGISAFAEVETSGVTTGDIDNDGHREILVTSLLGNPNVLLYNNGDGTFQQIPLPENGTEYWSAVAAFGDVNQDGFLDILIGNYIYESGFIQENGSVVGFDHDCSANRLYLSNGDLTFSDVSNIYGIDDTGCTLAVAFTDYDNDSDPDVLLSNDFGEWGQPNQLFQNDFPVPFYNNLSIQQNMDFPMYGMGIAIGDYDKDLDLDYYQTNIGSNRLSKNGPNGFTDVTEFAGVQNDSLDGLNTTSWGTFFADLDNDSWLDLFVANGVIPAAQLIANVALDPNKLYHNSGDGTFEDITASANVGSVLKGRGAAYGDLDKDGKLDILVNNLSNGEEQSQVNLFHNTTINTNHWLGVKLTGVQSNRDAFGSHVKIVLGNDSWIQELSGGDSHASQNSSIIHFGLGANSVADSIVVIFPSGSETVLTNVPADQIITVVEDVLTSSRTPSSQRKFDLIKSNYGYTLSIASTEFEETLSLNYIDLAGRLVKTERVIVKQGNNQHLVTPPEAKGIYLLSLRGKDFKWSKRIIFTED